MRRRAQNRHEVVHALLVPLARAEEVDDGAHVLERPAQVVPLEREDLDRRARVRLDVLPGITGLWQVSGRSDLDFDDLVRLDFLYLERWSVFLDLSILVKTVPAVLWRRGAF